jgi:hypothetical protein
MDFRRVFRYYALIAILARRGTAEFARTSKEASMRAESRHYQFLTSTGGVEFYADRGRVFVINLVQAAKADAPLETQIKSMPPGEFMKRAIAVRMSVDERFTDEVFRANQLLQRAVEVCKIAWHFGDPTDVRVLAQISKNRKKPGRILMPGDILPAIGGAQFKPSRITDQHEALLSGKGVGVTPDFSLSGEQLLTPSRAEKFRRRR